MRKTYYTDYARHCLRFYSRYPNKQVFDTDAEREDYASAYLALKDCSKYRLLLIEIYGGRDTLEDNVYNASKAHEISQDKIWQLMAKVELEVAKARGLK